MDLNQRLVLGLLTVAFFSGAVIYSMDDSGYEEPVEAEVTRVIDGDTIEVSIDGETETVRFIGMDTPEIHSENNPEYFEGVPDSPEGEKCLERWAKKSTEYVEQELNGSTVELKYEGDRMDRYDRLRAHIVIDGEKLNYRLVEKGYATTFPVEFENRSDFESAEESARNEAKNMWGCPESISLS